MIRLRTKTGLKSSYRLAQLIKIKHYTYVKGGVEGWLPTKSSDLRLREAPEGTASKDRKHSDMVFQSRAISLGGSNLWRLMMCTYWGF